MPRKPKVTEPVIVEIDLTPEVIEAPEVVANDVPAGFAEVTPAIEGMTIRLHNGERLTYGDSALTSLEHADLLREKGLIL